MKAIFKILIVSIGLLSLSACVNTGCEDYQSYRNAKSKAPVQVPSDLEQPDNEYLAPQVSKNDKTNIQKDASGNCLDKPPKL